ncbi:hypothetical protein SOVF_145060 [Spinacia oleracea]|nr:hypothetical protein SOVF_145060 [Spinacia oleracea]
MYNSMNSALYHLHISPHLFVFSSSSFSVLSYSYSRPTMDVAGSDKLVQNTNDVVEQDQECPISSPSTCNQKHPPQVSNPSFLVSNGSFCGYVDGALVFRVNSHGPASCTYMSRLAGRITENLVITVSLGRVLRLGFSLFKDVAVFVVGGPVVDTPRYRNGEQREGGIVIKEHVCLSFC